MNKYTIKGVTGEQFAKRMVFLAWNRSQVFGMGFMRDIGPQEEEGVWGNVISHGDYAVRQEKPGVVSADYVFGRMMKLRFKFGPDFIEGDDYPYRHDYQSFAGAYPNFAALVKAAAESLKVEVV